jgi:hypothetical protein
MVRHTCSALRLSQRQSGRVFVDNNGHAVLEENDGFWQTFFGRRGDCLPFSGADESPPRSASRFALKAHNERSGQIHGLSQSLFFPELD